MACRQWLLARFCNSALSARLLLIEFPLNCNLEETNFVSRRQTVAISLERTETWEQYALFCFLSISRYWSWIYCSHEVCTLNEVAIKLRLLLLSKISFYDVSWFTDVSRKRNWKFRRTKHSSLYHSMKENSLKWTAFHLERRKRSTRKVSIYVQSTKTRNEIPWMRRLLSRSAMGRHSCSLHRSWLSQFTEITTDYLLRHQQT